jgi:hypothetical protein
MLHCSSNSVVTNWRLIGQNTNYNCQYTLNTHTHIVNYRCLVTGTQILYLGILYTRNAEMRSTDHNNTRIFACLSYVRYYCKIWLRFSAGKNQCYFSRHDFSLHPTSSVQRMIFNLAWELVLSSGERGRKLEDSVVHARVLPVLGRSRSRESLSIPKPPYETS